MPKQLSTPQLSSATEGSVSAAERSIGSPELDGLQEAWLEAREVLDADELSVLITHAMERRAVELAEQAARDADTQRRETERVARRENPLAYVGLADMADQVAYVKLKRPFFQHERVVHLGGVTYEHIREDEDDVWIYRRM